MELHPPFLTGRLVRLRAPEPSDDTLNELINDHVNLVIERLEEPGAIGMCDLMRIEAPTRMAEMGIWIGRPWWQGGYGTDAVRTICRFGFDHVNLHRITLFVNADNPQAIRPTRRAGFVHEGSLREGTFAHGARVDQLLMGLLAGDLRDEP